MTTLSRTAAHLLGSSGLLQSTICPLTYKAPCPIDSSASLRRDCPGGDWNCCWITSLCSTLPQGVLIVPIFLLCIQNIPNGKSSSNCRLFSLHKGFAIPDKGVSSANILQSPSLINSLGPRSCLALPSGSSVLDGFRVYASFSHCKS